MSHFVLAHQEASINVLLSAEWMPEVTPSFKMHPIYLE